MPAVMGSNIPDQGVTSRMLNLTASAVLVVTDESSTSVTFADLATGGPAITPASGVTQEQLIIWSCGLYLTGGTSTVIASVALAGGAASDNDDVRLDAAAGVIATGAQSTVASQATGVANTMKYRVAAQTGHWFNRHLSQVGI